MNLTHNRLTLKNTLALVILFFITSLPALTGPAYEIKTIDFPGSTGLKINGAGPLLVRTDEKHNRIILVNTNTSSISLINTLSGQVENISTQNRVPQYLKSEALCLDNKTGNIYVIGNKSLHIALPDKKSSVTIPTQEQFEMVAVDENTGNAFLVGRESKNILMISYPSLKTTPIPWQSTSEKMANLNQTPPPPIRKIFCNTSHQQIIAIDGFSAELSLFSTNQGKLLSKRKLNVSGGNRWHTAGFNENTQSLYLVIETTQREVKEAIQIDTSHTNSPNDIIVQLPGFREGVGISYNPLRNEIYIPYDNEPSLHVVNFSPPQIQEIKLPNFGNDASAIDIHNDYLYISSWGYGEIDVIDLKTRHLCQRFPHVGTIPHMFNMAFLPPTSTTQKGKLYIPLGATAVNGSFGASLLTLDPATGTTDTIYTGWSPVALTELKHKDAFLVFNSENQAAEVKPDGSFTLHTLPCRWINQAITSPWGNIYVSYGPHQSYWPVVYIWAAKNGILSINPPDMSVYDRRIPRMTQQMTFDKNGALYMLQNNWGEEKQFLAILPDDVRYPNLGDQRLELDDTVTRETSQRLLEYDQEKNWLYIVRTGETDNQPGLLQVLDLNALTKGPQPPRKPLFTYPTGLTPTGLAINRTTIFITNFDDNTMTAITKGDFQVKKYKTGQKPFQLALIEHTPYWINHLENTLQYLDKNDKVKTLAIPFPGQPSGLFSTGQELVITSHTVEALYIISFQPKKLHRGFTLIHRDVYPYGETTVATDNSAFYMRGQFADGIFQLNQFKKDRKGRFWITDYLSGRCFIIEPIYNNL